MSKSFFSRTFCGLLLCLASATFTTAHAATFNVTSNLCTGAGSLQAAITAANTNPGPDVISFASGLEVDVGACPDGPDGSEGYFADVTDDVTFEGNGAKLMGHISWVTAGGLVTPLNKCPATQSGTIIVAKTAGFLSVAGGKSVVVKNLSVREVHSIAYVGNNASLVLEDFTAERVLPFSNCAASALEAGGNANLTLRRNHWDTVVSWPPFILPPISVFPAIVGEDVGNLVIEDSFFFRLVHGDGRSGLVYWSAPAGKTVKIVSTRMDGTGGIVAQGGVDTFIVNSAWVNDSFSSYASVTERIVNASTGTMKIVGSTIMAGGVDCDDGCQPNPGAGIPDSNGLIRALSGRIDLVESAIGVNLPSDQGKVLSEESQTGYPGGDIRADARTWIQPDVQTAAELKSITNQPGLLTEAPGLARFEPVTEFVPFVSPLLGTGGNPGKLIDVIPDATCGGANKLLNPIDGSCITTDVFGNSRWDTGNNKRNIGAVQLTLSPHLSAVGIASNAVQLSWSRPQDPVSGVITGYAVFYRPTGTADPLTRVDITGAATLSAWITGLTNGTVYDFKAVAVNGVGDGPDSSVVTAVPFGVIQAPVLTTPTAGDGQVKLDWSVPDSGGYTITGYHVFFRQQGTAQWVAYQTVAALTDTVHGLVNGVAYEFAVSTATSGGESSLSTPVLATPSGPAAVPLFVTPGNASVMLGWNPAAAVNAAFYRIEYRPHNLLAWTQLPKKAAGPVTQLVSGLINQQLYDFRVIVLDSGDQIIAASNIASATPGLQTILGSKMVVKNPGNNPLKRSVILRSKDKQHLDELFGDPTVTGAELTVIANGENGSSQVFTLPASGWKAVQHGYRYHDNKGINGPVKQARITVQRKGAFIINANITGKHGTVDIVPPNPGVDGGFILDFSSSGRYCVLFDGNTIQKDSYEELWKISKPLVRGCPVAVP